MYSDEIIEEVLINLRVMGKIEPLMKLNTKEKYLELDESVWWTQGLYRTIRGDSKKTALSKIHNTITKSMMILNLVLNNHLSISFTTKNEFVSDMYKILEKTHQGLNNLADTYSKHKTFTSELELDIESVKRQLQLIRDYQQNWTQQQNEQQQSWPTLQVIQQTENEKK